MFDILAKKLNEHNAPPDAEKKIRRYIEFLLLENEKFNLTSITDEHEIIVKHIIDSLAAAPYIMKNASVLDIGSGAGLPGLIIKIARPDIDLKLIDSVNKKVAFINSAIAMLNLSCAVAEHKRAEELPKNILYDVVVSRAVAELRTLAEYSLPFLKFGGKLIAYKSSKAEEEIDSAANSLKILGGEVEEIVDVSIEENIRKLVIIKKTHNTPDKYPRNKNKPRLKPL